jgi:hypothetical protein
VSGNDVNSLGVIPACTVDDSVRAAATTVDKERGYTAAAKIEVQPKDMSNEIYYLDHHLISRSMSTALCP